jgi:hypothetical protein
MVPLAPGDIWNTCIKVWLTMLMGDDVPTLDLQKMVGEELE